jgi:hypothetical protein
MKNLISNHQIPAGSIPAFCPISTAFCTCCRSHCRVARLSCRARVDRAADIVAVTLRNSRPSSSACNSFQRSFGVMVRTPNRQSIAGGSTAQNSLCRLEKFESPEGKVPPDSKRPPHQFAHCCLAKSAQRTFQRDSNRSTGIGLPSHRSDTSPKTSSRSAKKRCTTGWLNRCEATVEHPPLLQTFATDAGSTFRLPPCFDRFTRRVRPASNLMPRDFRSATPSRNQPTNASEYCRQPGSC